MTRVVPQIGLTGSIGSGKSAVAELFRAWGSQIVDADLFARELLAPNSPQLTTIISQFGPQITRPDGSLDRFALRSLIFSDAAAKQTLENLLHPEIRKLMLAEARRMLEAGCVSVTLVIPLLFESKTPYPNLTHSIAVNSDREICIERASKRDHCSPNTIAKIFDSQMSPEDKEKQADFIIKNNGTLEELECNARVVFDNIHKGII
jgi:dephospho-CoA kinase